MTWRDDLAKKPWKHDFYAVLGRFEALNPELPRIGDSSTRRDEYIDLGQIPHLDFPASNIATFDPGSAGKNPRMRVRFLGMLGPMGPLPLTTTQEAYTWYRANDDSFTRFLDIFNHRFLQLFFRAHADSRPAFQMRNINRDRFRDYVGSTIGIGVDFWRDIDSLPDYTKLAYAGLLGARGASASRIEHLIAGIFDVEVQVEEFIGAYLDVDPADQTRLGQAHARLGRGAMAGSRILTVDTRFRLVIHVETLREYENFLPGGRWSKFLIDALSNAVGFEYDWEVELVLPRECAAPTKLGSFGRLGWTTWVPERDDESAPSVVRTRFSAIREDSGSMLN